MLSKLVGLVPVLLAAGCFSSGDRDWGSTTLADSQLDELMVYDTGLVCITAPCPYYRVVDRAGNEVDAASIEFDPMALRPREVPVGGLVVKGRIDVGDWTPGDSGNVLQVATTVGAPPRYLTFADANDGGYGFIAEDHSMGLSPKVVLTPMLLDPVEARHVETDLQDARVIARGWLTEIGMFVTDTASTPKVYTVADNGIRCVVDPCPSIAVYDALGREVFQVASVDLTAMQLKPGAEGQWHDAFMTGVPLEAWIVDGSWQPHDTGAVLYVTRDYQPQLARFAEWGPQAFELTDRPSGPVLR